MTEDYNNPELPDVIVPTGNGDETIKVNDVPLDKQVKVTPDGKGGYTISFEDKPPPSGPGGDAPPPPAPGTPPAPGAPAPGAPAPGAPAPGAPAPAPDPAPPPSAPEAPPKVPPKAPEPAPPGTPDTPPPKAPEPAPPGTPDTPPPKAPEPAPPGTPDTPPPKAPEPAPPGAPGAPPPEAPAPGTPVPKGNMEYSSPYREGDTIDKKFLDDAEAKGGIPGEDDKGNKTVTLNGFEYKEGDKLTQYGADKALEAGMEKPEKGMGYYHEGDRITPEMIQDLKKQGFTEDDEGNLVSPDGETKIPMPDTQNPYKNLSKDDADALTKAGIQKSSAYLRNHPDSINNPDNSNFIGDEPDITEQQAKDMQYDGDLNGVDGHKPKIVEGKGDNNDVVYEYDKELGGYKAVGEKYDGGAYFPYSEEQIYKVNVEHSLPAGNAWGDQD